ncbi:MAG: IPTL-CTERM sorting domain-containing protein [Ottowia sp.]|uniref:IPTL-CTERM sorting domain-containing protein n=1 Tax=Ottowia sp. TaxID=1898956 RepID=UPI0039E52953
MPFSSLPVFRRALSAALLAGFAATAAAAPYGITYNGVIDTSEGYPLPPGVIDGQTYSVTFVFDNGGSTAQSQTWGPAHLTCAIWHMNNAGNVVYMQNLVARPPATALGTVTTDASGVLTSVFSEVTDENVPASAYTASNFSPGVVSWFANDMNGVFYGLDGGAVMYDNSSEAGGVQMDIDEWSNPMPFTGNCATTTPSIPTVTAVPTTTEWSLALLGLMAAGLGAARLRRRRG